MVTSCANAILRRSHPTSSDMTQSPSPPPQVDKQWTTRFLERHSQYLVPQQKAQEIDRKNAQDPDTILEWFYKYKSICDKYGILPRDQYNFDESGFRIGVGRNQ